MNYLVRNHIGINSMKKMFTSRPACARVVVMGRFHALRISHKMMFWFGVIRTFKLYFSIISLNVFFILPAIRPLSTWSPQNKPPSPCGKFSNSHKHRPKWEKKRQFIHNRPYERINAMIYNMLCQ